MSTTPLIAATRNAPSADRIAGELERFVRVQFDIPDDDEEFGREVNLWEEGYVDSAGVVEVVSHLEERWGVKSPRRRSSTRASPASAAWPRSWLR